MRFRIGVSIGCYLPWAAVVPGLAVRAAHRARFEFLQLLPLRGLWTPNAVNDRALRLLPKRYMERAWGCPQSFMQVASDAYHHRTDCPTMVDYAFFGTHAEETFDRLRYYYPEAWVIEHHFIPGARLVEVHPGLWMNVERIKDTVAMLRWRGKPVSLVVDSCHLREEPTPWQLAQRPQDFEFDRSLLGCWHNSLPELLPECSVFHLQPLRDGGKELANCLKHKPTELGEMLACVKEYPGLLEDIVVEATLGLFSIDFPSLCSMLSEFRCWIIEQLA